MICYAAYLKKASFYSDMNKKMLFAAYGFKLFSVFPIHFLNHSVFAIA